MFILFSGQRLPAGQKQKRENPLKIGSYPTPYSSQRRSSIPNTSQKGSKVINGRNVLSEKRVSKAERNDDISFILFLQQKKKN